MLSRLSILNTFRSKLILLTFHFTNIDIILFWNVSLWCHVWRGEVYKTLVVVATDPFEMCAVLRLWDRPHPPSVFLTRIIYYLFVGYQTLSWIIILTYPTLRNTKLTAQLVIKMRVDKDRISIRTIGRLFHTCVGFMTRLSITAYLSCKTMRITIKSRTHAISSC